MSKWQHRWDTEKQKELASIVSFQVGEKVWYYHNTPGIIREVDEEREARSIFKYRVQLPTCTISCGYRQLSKVKAEDLR